MDNGGIWPGDESYFQNIRETALQDTIEQLTKELAEARAENAALVAEFQRMADEPPTLEEIAADLDKIEMLGKELAEAQTEVERLALEIENKQYTITCASEENQQLKESLSEARAEIERQTDRIISDACIISTAALAIAERDKLIEQMRDALQEVMVLCDAVPTRAHDMAKDYHLREIGRIVNVKGLYRVVKAALSAVERETK